MVTSTRRAPERVTDQRQATRRLVLVEGSDKRTDGYVRCEGWKPGQQAVARFFDKEMGRWFVEMWNMTIALDEDATK